MTLFVCWFVFPLVMGALCLGCGLALEAAAGFRLPRPLVAPAGLALVIVVARLAIGTSVTVQLAMPLVVAIAVAGFALRRPWREDWRAGRWALAAAAGVFAVYAAPVVLSGNATFAGYIKLDDTATWLALTDHAMNHGNSQANLPVSTYGATLGSYLRTAYPLGAFLPLGIGHRLVGEDIAWIFQPYEAFLAAMLSLCLYWPVKRAVGSRPLAALAAFGGAQAATLYAYSLWGGVKEVAAAWLMALTATLAADAILEARTGRAVLPVAVSTAAGLAVLSIGAVAWLGPALALAALFALRYQRRDLPFRQAAAFFPMAAVLALPALATASTFAGPGHDVLTNANELGNLGDPLNKLQALGIWPVGDFRRAATHPTITHILLGLLVASALLAVVAAWRRRAWQLPLVVVSTAVACGLVVHYGSPWVDGKAYATGSAAFIATGLAGAGILLATRTLGGRVAGAALAVAILGGVLWSNALAFRDVDLAPRSQLAELQHIGNAFAGQGPALLNDYEPYGARHFLRKLDAESVSELRVHVIPLRNGSEVPKTASADLDQFPVSSLLPYRTIVLHRSPVESRPPAGYRLVWRGRYWDVWQRPPRAPRTIVSDLPLGSRFQPGAVPDCRSVLALAKKVPAGGALAAVPRARPEVMQLTGGPTPPGWFPDPYHPGALDPGGGGTLSLTGVVPRTSGYAIWMGGTFKSRVRVYIDGRLAASARGVLQWEPFVKIGQARIGAGRLHQVRIVYDTPSLLHAGSGGFESGLGPLAFSSEKGSQPVTYVAPARARSLCGRYLDWIEAVGPSAG